MIFSFPPSDRHSQPAAGRRTGPSRAWYVLALVVFLLSTAGIGAKIYGIIKSFPQGAKFLVPGSASISVEEPGTYGLWDEYSTFFENRRYENNGELPGGMTIRIRGAQTGTEVPFSPSSGGTETVGNVKRKAVGEITFDRPGRYVIEVAGDFPQRVFYVRRSAAGEIFSGVALIAVLGLAGWVLAPMLAVIVLVRRSAGREKAPAPIEVRTAEATPAAAGVPVAKEERTYAMFCHLGALSGLLVPFGNIIVPLVLWLIKKDSSPFIDRHGRESLNFQVSMLIYSLVSAVFILVVIGFFLLAALWIFNLVAVIIAGVRAESGEHFRYPLTIRFFG